MKFGRLKRDLKNGRYDLFPEPCDDEGLLASGRGKAGAAVAGVVKRKRRFNLRLLQLGLVEYTFVVFVLFTFSLFFVYNVMRPDVVVENTMVQEMLDRQNGALATANFLTLTVFLLCCLTSLFKKHSVDWCQGSATN